MFTQTFQEKCDSTYQSWAEISRFETVYRTYYYDGPAVVYRVYSVFSDNTEELFYQGSSERKAEEAWESAISPKKNPAYLNNI